MLSSSQLSWQFVRERPASQWDRVLSIEFPVRVIASGIDEIVILFRACGHWDYLPLLSAKMSCQVVSKLVTFLLRGYKFDVRTRGRTFHHIIDIYMRYSRAINHPYNHPYPL